MVFIHVKNEHEIVDLLIRHLYFFQLEVTDVVKLYARILPLLVLYGLQNRVARSMDIGGCLPELCLKKLLVALDICNGSNRKNIPQIYQSLASLQ